MRMKSARRISSWAVLGLTWGLPALAQVPHRGVIERYTQDSLEHALQLSLLQPLERTVYRTVVTGFAHTPDRNYPYPRLERLLHRALDDQGVDFYELRFELVDRSTEESRYAITCQITDWQSQHYFDLSNCFTQNGFHKALSASDTRGMPFYLAHLRPESPWFFLYSEVRFQNP